MVFRVFHNTSKRRYWKWNLLLLQCYSVHLHNQFIKYFFPENEKHQITVLSLVFQNFFPIPEYQVFVLFLALLSGSQCLWCFHVSFAWFCHKYRKMTFTGLEGYPYKSCGSVSLPGLHKTCLGQGQTFPFFSYPLHKPFGCFDLYCKWKCLAVYGMPSTNFCLPTQFNFIFSSITAQQKTMDWIEGLAFHF